MKSHCKPIRMSKILKISTKLSVWEDMEQTEFSCIACGNIKSYNRIGNSQFLKKLKLYLLYDSAIILLDIYPWEKKAYIHAGTCTNWKRLKCKSVDKWINLSVYRILSNCKAKWTTDVCNSKEEYTSHDCIFCSASWPIYGWLQTYE